MVFLRWKSVAHNTHTHTHTHTFTVSTGYRRSCLEVDTAAPATRPEIALDAADSVSAGSVGSRSLPEVPI